MAAATRHGLSHLFFITKYTGTEARYKNKYFIVGTVEIDATAPINDRTAIHSPKMVFTDIEHAYEVTPERWQKICPDPKHPDLRNLRWATQQIEGELFQEITNVIAENDRSVDFLKEVDRLNQIKYERIRQKTQEQYISEPVLEIEGL